VGIGGILIGMSLAGLTPLVVAMFYEDFLRKERQQMEVLRGKDVPFRIGALCGIVWNETGQHGILETPNFIINSSGGEGQNHINVTHRELGVVIWHENYDYGYWCGPYGPWRQELIDYVTSYEERKRLAKEARHCDKCEHCVILSYSKDLWCRKLDFSPKPTDTFDCFELGGHKKTVAELIIVEPKRRKLTLWERLRGWTEC
jgi:hypothetical protein